MTLRFEPFKIEDAFDFEYQPQHQWLMPLLEEHRGDLKYIMESPYSWTAFDDSGKVVGCCGIMTDGYAWALLSSDLFSNMISITTRVREALYQHALEKGPVYADVDPMFTPAVRWARLLGFHQEGDRLWTFDAHPV